MSATTETEIFDVLSENFRLAAEHCAELASAPFRGPVYEKLREELKLIEGASLQAAWWREDTRWLKIGTAMGMAHQQAGGWLREHWTRDGRKVAHPLFLKLAAYLVALHKDCERLKTEATGRSGLILPTPERGPHRDTRPVQVKTPGGLILPASWRERGLRRRTA